MTYWGTLCQYWVNVGPTSVTLHNVNQVLVQLKCFLGSLLGSCAPVIAYYGGSPNANCQHANFWELADEEMGYSET